jgi:ribonucleoside-diphosphate reductase alpha chain
MPYPVAPTSPEGFFNPHEEEWKGAILPQLRVPGADSQIQYKPARRRLDPERKSATRVLRLGTLKVYVTVGEYPDGTPGEIFLRAAKVGSIERGLLEALSLTVSLALQHGVPLADLTAKYRNLNFSPQGLTGDGEFPSVSSIVDYLGQWLESRYGK